MKLYRFWKLCTKGFSAVNTQTQQYIVSGAESAIRSDPTRFQHFYCTYVLGGKSSNYTCTLSNCDDARRLEKDHEVVFAEDMRDFWTSTAAGVAAGIKWICGIPNF